jgi:hypothetical protein
MEAKTARLEAQIDKVRADLSRANITVRALQADIQAARAEISAVIWQIRVRDQSADFRTAVIVPIVLTFALFAALWRSVGWL